MRTIEELRESGISWEQLSPEEQNFFNGIAGRVNEDSEKISRYQRLIALANVNGRCCGTTELGKLIVGGKLSGTWAFHFESVHGIPHEVFPRMVADVITQEHGENERS